MTTEPDHTQTIFIPLENAASQKAKIMSNLMLASDAVIRADFQKKDYDCSRFDGENDWYNDYGQKVMFVHKALNPGNGYDLLKDETLFPKEDRPKGKQVKYQFWKRIGVYQAKAQTELANAGMVWNELLINQGTTPQTYYPSNKAVCKNLYTVFIEDGKANEHVAREKLSEVWKYMVECLTEGGKPLKPGDFTKSSIVAAAKNMQEHITNAPERKKQWETLTNIQEYLEEEFGTEIVSAYVEELCITRCTEDSSLKKIDNEISKMQTIGWELKARWTFVACRNILEDLGLLSEEVLWSEN